LFVCCVETDFGSLYTTTTWRWQENALYCKTADAKTTTQMRMTKLCLTIPNAFLDRRRIESRQVVRLQERRRRHVERALARAGIERIDIASRLKEMMMCEYVFLNVRNDFV
jgi:hypothetical protein